MNPIGVASIGMEIAQITQSKIMEMMERHPTKDEKKSKLKNQVEYYKSSQHCLKEFQTCVLKLKTR